MEDTMDEELKKKLEETNDYLRKINDKLMLFVVLTILAVISSVLF